MSLELSGLPRFAGATRRSFLRAAGLGALATRIGRSADPPYALVALPDLQHLAAGGPLYSQVMQWVVDNRRTTALDGTELNIIGVVAVGDCVNAAGADEATGECAAVKSAYQILDRAGIPFITPPGNRDYLAGRPVAAREPGGNFRAGGLFSPSVRALQSGYGGSYDESRGIARANSSGANWWITLTWGARRILIIALEFFPRDAVVSWARGVHDAHPGYECIVTTHGYLTDAGLRSTRNVPNGPQEYGLADNSPQAPTAPGYGLTGEQMWGAATIGNATSAFRTWPNLTAVLSGHFLYEAGRTNSSRYHRLAVPSDSPRRQTVHQFFCNAQDLDLAQDANGANLCVLRFDPARGSMSTFWMSRRNLTFSSDSVTYLSGVRTMEINAPYPGIDGGTQPVPSIAGVVNGASYAAAIAPASWIVIRGANLTPAAAPRTWRAEEIVGGVLPKLLDGVGVTVNGKPAAVYYISPTQINAVAPDDAASGFVSVEASVNGVRSAPFFVELQQRAPGLFQWQGSDVAATHADFTPVARPGIAGGAPARRGETITLWATGLGKTAPEVPADRVAPPGSFLPDPVTVHFEGASPQAVEGQAALAPGLAAVYQIAVRVPDAAAAGDVPVWIEVRGVRSQTAVLAVG